MPTQQPTHPTGVPTGTPTSIPTAHPTSAPTTTYTCVVVKFYLNVSAVTREQLQLILIPALQVKVPSIRFNAVDVYVPYPHNVCGRDVRSTIMRRLTNLTSDSPTGQPSYFPSYFPSVAPSSVPSLSPTKPTGFPTPHPSQQPSAAPTARPTVRPTSTSRPSFTHQPAYPTFAPSTVSVSHGVTEVTFDVTTSEFSRFSFRS